MPLVARKPIRWCGRELNPGDLLEPQPEGLKRERLISGGHVAHAETDRVPTDKHVGRPTVPKINRQTGRRSRYPGRRTKE